MQTIQLFITQATMKASIYVDIKTLEERKKKQKEKINLIYSEKSM